MRPCAKAFRKVDVLLFNGSEFSQEYERKFNKATEVHHRVKSLINRLGFIFLQ